MRKFCVRLLIFYIVMFLMLIKNDSVQTDPVVFRNNKVYQVISVIPVLKSSQNSNKDDNNNDNNSYYTK